MVPLPDHICNSHQLWHSLDRFVVFESFSNEKKFVKVFPKKKYIIKFTKKINEKAYEQIEMKTQTLTCAIRKILSDYKDSFNVYISASAC
jgi:uncharacterized protein YsxB (DUF464 family)